MVKLKSNLIKEHIQKNGFTIRKFAEIVGVSVAEMNKMINGDLNFKFISLVKLARYFKVSEECLLDSGMLRVETKFYL